MTRRARGLPTNCALMQKLCKHMRRLELPTPRSARLIATTPPHTTRCLLTPSKSTHPRGQGRNVLARLAYSPRNDAQAPSTGLALCRGPATRSVPPAASRLPSLLSSTSLRSLSSIVPLRTQRHRQPWCTSHSPNPPPKSPRFSTSLLLPRCPKNRGCRAASPGRQGCRCSPRRSGG